MAGGMNKRGAYGSMAERVAASRSAAPAAPTAEPSPGPRQAPPAADPSAAPAGVKHCWVTDRHGRLPALLLGWQRRTDGWHGRVVRPVHDGDGWVVVEEWLPAGLLDPIARQ
jgi:hypothetical protein